MPRFDLDDPGASWFCARCGAAYARRPERCEACGGEEFLPRSEAETLAAEGAAAEDAVALARVADPLARARIGALLEEEGVPYAIEDLPAAGRRSSAQRVGPRIVVSPADLSRARAVLERWRREEEESVARDPWEEPPRVLDPSPGDRSAEADDASPVPVARSPFPVRPSRYNLGVSCIAVFGASAPVIGPAGLFLLDGRVEEGARLLLALGAVCAGLLLTLVRPIAGAVVTAGAYSFLVVTAWRLGVAFPFLFTAGALALLNVARIAIVAPPAGPPAH